MNLASFGRPNLMILASYGGPNPFQWGLKSIQKLSKIRSDLELGIKRRGTHVLKLFWVRFGCGSGGHFGAKIGIQGILESLLKTKLDLIL